MRSIRQWKTLCETKGIPAGSVIEEIHPANVKSKITQTLSLLRKNKPNERYAICNHNGDQLIFKVGRDIIPYSVGVGTRVKP